MDENKKDFRNWLSELGVIVETIEKTFISENCKIVVELDEEKFRKFQMNFREIDRKRNEIVIVVDNVEFTFFLKK